MYTPRQLSSASSCVRLLSFNAYHLRMIASSREKTDKRDAYWIAKALQTGMTPHPVDIPTGEVRPLARPDFSEPNTIPNDATTCDALELCT